MNIVFMGTPDFAVPTLKALVKAGHNVKAVFSQPDKPKGRGYKLTPPPVKVCAQENNIEVFQPQSFKKGEDAEKSIQILKDIAPDYIIVVAYGKLLPKEVLNIPKYGCINVHASLLPKYRGAGPIQWCVLNGEKETGVTTMIMGEGLDTGDMLLKASTGIGKNETASELHDRLSVLGANLLIKTLEELEKGNITPQKQDDSLSCYAPMLSKDMCPIDFSKSVTEIHNQIRGLSDWPCATAILNDKRIKIYKSEIISTNDKNDNFGQIINEKDLTVLCGTGSLRILELQAEGSKRMKTADYLRGNPVEKNQMFR